MPLPGNVVSLRINTKDTMSVIDLVSKLGVPMNTLSFPSMVSLALGSLLESMRQQDALPVRDGFEYLQMTAGIVGTGQNKKKRAATKSILEMGSELNVQPPKNFGQRESYVYGPVVMSQDGTPTSTVIPLPTPDEVEQRKRLSELVSLLDQFEEKMPGITWTTTNQMEYDELVKVIYG